MNTINTRRLKPILIAKVMLFSENKQSLLNF